MTVRKVPRIRVPGNAWMCMGVSRREWVRARVRVVREGSSAFPRA